MKAETSYTNWKGWSEDKFMEVSRNERAYFSAEFSAFLQQPKKNFRVLELGFGNGSFMAWCKEQGWEIHGVEINDELLKRASGRGIPAYRDVRDIPDGCSFDLVVAIDVIEHLIWEDILRLFKDMSRLMKDDAVLLFTVPNGGSPFGRYAQHGDCTHKTTIGPGKVMQLGIMTSFEIITMKNPAVPLIGVGITLGFKRFFGVLIRWFIESVLRLVYFAWADVTLGPSLLVVLKKRAVLEAAQ
jgi:SAM-dependent methyltransferase